MHAGCGRYDWNPTTGGDPRLVARRWFLQRCGVGLGAAALGELLCDGASAAATFDPLAPKLPPSFGRIKQVIYLFMAGGPSHLELFDNKPQLTKWDGKLPPAELLAGYRAAFIDPNSVLMGPKFRFAKHGQSGIEVSELLPHTAKIVDDLCVVKSLSTDAFNHAPAQLMMNTGTMQFGRPSLGSWTLYGLGCESRDLPSFVVFSTGTKGPSAGTANWGSGFLPSVYQGVQLRAGEEPVLYLRNPPGVDDSLQQDTLQRLKTLNQMHLGETGDPEIVTRINSYEMAYRMQSAAPEAVDLATESQHTLDAYGAEPGKPTFANACLLARRLVERGVRFVQIFHEAWDQHGYLAPDIENNCLATDRASAALVADLKQRGLLDSTLVVWGGEFGRTPMVQGNPADRSAGRDHHPNCYSIWMAGGGLKSGVAVGESDDFGFNAVRDKIHVHDLNATILHLMGFDHTKLTFRFQGRDFRLTDVHGRVAAELLA
jgi:hypothetical protein